MPAFRNLARYKANRLVIEILDVTGTNGKNIVFSIYGSGNSGSVSFNETAFFSDTTPKNLYIDIEALAEDLFKVTVGGSQKNYYILRMPNKTIDDFITSIYIGVSTTGSTINSGTFNLYAIKGE